MSKLIFGVDPNKKVTPLMVRDALVSCFHEAHCADTGLDTVEEKLNREYCRLKVEKAFNKADADFEKPTKESIIKVMDKLAEFSKGFRDSKIIKEHYDNIMLLVEKL